MILIDAHEDIAWNIATFGRDYLAGAAAIRRKEADTSIPSYNGNALLGLPEWLNGKVAIIFATLYTAPAKHVLGSWDAQAYRTIAEAYQRANAQLDAYYRLVNSHPQLQMIGNQTDLATVLESWQDADASDEERTIGFVPLMEGADPIRDPSEVHEWYERGLRIIGLSWEGTRYAGGTNEPGPLTSLGYQLLEHMQNLGMILDLSHTAEQAYYQAVEAYTGPMIASHANPRRFLPTSRGLSDEMITVLCERGGVMGIVPFNRFLKPGWMKGNHREEVPLITIVDAIDHVCQVTGSADHVGIGSDFDGGFGLEHVPDGIDTIADLQKLVPLLAERGYAAEQIEKIMSGNWLRVLQSALPE